MRPGEAIYVRDEDTGEVWGPTALPIREKTASYAARHGQGYSRFDHDSHGIALELLQFVPVDDSIKISRLKITNRSGRARRLSITAYVEWVLGPNRSATAPFVVTEIDPETGAIFARNPWSEQFGERVAFADLNGQQTAWTGDRTEFLGRDGAMDWPLALTSGARLSNRVGRRPRSVRRAADAGDAGCRGHNGDRLLSRAVAERGRSAIAARKVSQGRSRRGHSPRSPGNGTTRSGSCRSRRPTARWIFFSTAGCPIRPWPAGYGRAPAFYQASGAYGFRDQLQDVMALCVSRPEIARAHILIAAARQFVEGDVQHWWLPESGRGVRTRVSDDRGWLVYVVAHYIRTTGDIAVLDETVPFLEGPVLKDGERDAFFLPAMAGAKASLFEHCALALDKSLATGAHGLPLMGTGDWNDGMDGVGDGGKGESVWLGWFLYAALMAFADLAEQHHNPERAAAWRQHAATLQDSLEREAWDGDWYRRAYFDDGSPLGSVANDECRIDSIAQSWAVISGAAEATHAARAMAALDKYLLRRDDSVIAAVHPALQSSGARSRLYQGLPAGHSGEWRTIHPWRGLGRAGLRHAGRRRPGGRVAVDAQPDPPCRQPNRHPPL